MRYYHIDNGAIASGPHAANSAYIKRLTRCGEPEKLDLAAFGLLPEARDALGENQRYGEPVVEAAQVRIPAVDKTAEELAAELQAQREGAQCTRLQGRLALVQFGLWDAVAAYFADTASRTPIELAFWEDAQVWKRSDATLTAAATSFGLTDSDIDDLFALAGTL
jgi:hypothetical protein